MAILFTPFVPAQAQPGAEQVLTDYPHGDVEGFEDLFQWIDYDIDGTAIYVLTHAMVVPFADARVVVQRQFYVSTGYNAEQAIAAFLPVAEGSIVAYTNHTFTDQVAGWGGSAKRSIGRGIMTKKLEAMFERSRQAAAN